MRSIQVYALFLVLVCHTDIKDTVTSYGPNTIVRNVKQDRNGNILLAEFSL